MQSIIFFIDFFNAFHLTNYVSSLMPFNVKLQCRRGIGYHGNENMNEAFVESNTVAGRPEFSKNLGFIEVHPGFIHFFRKKKNGMAIKTILFWYGY